MNKAHLALVASTLIYGLFYVAIKFLVNEISPWETFCLRLFLATPLFFLIERFTSRIRIPSRADLLKITGLGLLGVSIVQVTIVLGVNYTSVFHTGFIVGMAPLFTLVFSVLLKQEKLTLHKVLGILIAFIGLIMLLFSRGDATHLPSTYLWGDLLVFANISGWSLFLVLSRPMLDRYPPFALTSYAFVLSGLVTFPLMILSLEQFPGTGLSPSGWAWMAFMVLLSTLLTYFINYYALARLGASTVAVYVFLQPLVTAFFANVLLQEPITLIMILEGLVILAGVSVATGSYKPIKQWLFARNTG
jgi:drug/metabolite transporter (DMT)-like permease